MALKVGGVTVTGTQTLDATKLTGNLPAISGASLTNIPATVFANADTVGMFYFGKGEASDSVPGDVQTGTNVRYADANGNILPNPRPSGTQRQMGHQTSPITGTVFQRIT